ncbi:MAG: ATP-binding protein [Desulfovibrio sp.]|uniref:ATP-binding protein n=1 Tax=Desulfovibrio sp. 7SRBS1 TaxID=3378064 RepID=UPI003B41265A
MAVSHIPSSHTAPSGHAGGKIPDRLGAAAGSGSVISLRSRILLLLAALMVVNLTGAGLSIWYTDRAKGLYESTMDHDFQALMAAQGLETALLMQKGLTTYFFLNNDPAWLEQLTAYEQNFGNYLEQARKSVIDPEQRNLLNRIESEYGNFTHARDQVIALYKDGRREEGAKLHWAVRDGFSRAFTLCEDFRNSYRERVLTARANYNKEAHLISLVTLGAMPGVFGLGLLLIYILMKQVLIPLRRLVVGSGLMERDTVPDDEVQALSRSFENLMADRDSAHVQLEKSQEILLQAEKLALVGKMAAGVAHSVRNPLTSLKMRLFSLERSLSLDPMQREDFEVISEEIKHIDTILNNFLEFSRPPKMRFQSVSPSAVVDNTLQLLRHRLQSGNVDIQLHRDDPLPPTAIDPEQLKEALVNIILNACEAMVEGGTITISEDLGVVDGVGRMILIRVADNGPGVPKSIMDDIFSPFFSTKEEGSGLGLAISRRILEDHGGWLSLKSKEGYGAIFSLAVPCKEACPWP